MLKHLRCRERGGLDHDRGGVFFDADAVTQFAVDLDGHLDFIFDEQGGIVFGPGVRGEQGAVVRELRCQRLVEFFRQMRRERI